MTIASGPEDPAACVQAAAGIGLRSVHVAEFLAGRPAGFGDGGWLEIHSENYLCAGAPSSRALETLRRDYPVSCHGVGLSPGSADGLDAEHLRALADLFARIEPGLISEHLSWSIHSGVYLNDLIALPYNQETLEIVARNIHRAQEFFGRKLLIENPSAYLAYRDSDIPETEFLAELARRTGCGLLLDVNNVFVSARNLDFDPLDYLESFPAAAVEEIHVAGHASRQADSRTILIDDHGGPVAGEVWKLLKVALNRLGPRPVLVEWDTNIPPLPELLGEARKAQAILDGLDRSGGGTHAA